MKWGSLFLLLIFCGCYSYAPPAPVPTSFTEGDQTVGAGQPVEYWAGYREGCDSGYFSAGDSAYSIQKDVPRYNEDARYRQGWDDGLRNCQMAGRQAHRDRYYYPSWYFLSFGFYSGHGHHFGFGHHFGHRHHH